jgi:hypothetical protein
MSNLQTTDECCDIGEVAGHRVSRAPRYLEPKSDSRTASLPLPNALVGVLLGFCNSGTIPLVTFPGQPGQAAIPARATHDLHSIHIGQQVVLVFEAGDPRRPIITGLLRQAQSWPLADQPGHVEVEADGARLVVNARDQLVLRCGKATITLTKAGKILLEGTYVSSHSSGVQRIKGGSVQIN